MAGRNAERFGLKGMFTVMLGVALGLSFIAAVRRQANFNARRAAAVRSARNLGTGETRGSLFFDGLTLNDDWVVEHLPYLPYRRLSFKNAAFPEWTLAYLPSGSTEIILDGSDLTDAGLQQLGGKVRRLSLRRTKITDQCAASLASLRYLEELSLSGTSLGDDAIASIGRSTSIKKLTLIGTPVSDQSIAALAGMASLVEVNLDETRVTAEGIRRLHALNPALRAATRELELGDPASQWGEAGAGLSCRVLTCALTTDEQAQDGDDNRLLVSLEIRNDSTHPLVLDGTSSVAMEFERGRWSLLESAVSVVPDGKNTLRVPPGDSCVTRFTAKVPGRIMTRMDAGVRVCGRFDNEHLTSVTGELSHFWRGIVVSDHFVLTWKKK